MSVKQIFGIGNPLLDMSVNVEPAFLEKYGIKPANATLAEEKDMPLFEEVEKDANIKYVAGGATQNSIRGAAVCISILFRFKYSVFPSLIFSKVSNN
jgi:adenosine kinase